MKVTNIQQMLTIHDEPFLVITPGRTDAYVRCVGQTDSLPLIPNALYRVNSVMAVKCESGKRTSSYTVEGFANGLRSGIHVMASLFKRFVPDVGDPVRIGVSEVVSVISKIEDKAVEHPVLHFHIFKEGEWVYAGKAAAPDITPVLGVAINEHVVAAFRGVEDPANVRVEDKVYAPPRLAAAAILAGGDMAAEREMAGLRFQHNQHLEAAVVASRKHHDHMGEYLPLHEEMTKVVKGKREIK
jgi:hypothetical protein